MDVTVNYLRGAFVAFFPGQESDPSGNRRTVIPFRFNPESLSRQLSVEQGNSGSPSGGATQPSGPDAAGASQDEASDASSGALKEAFTVQVRIDAADRLESASLLPRELGVAPEIAALEELLHPRELETEAPSDGSEPVRARPQRPTVLFVWGRKRVYPIRITGMTINETMHNALLNPVRAEIDVAAEVLGEASARDDLNVRAALDHTARSRRQLAQQFFDSTAESSSSIVPL